MADAFDQTGPIADAGAIGRWTSAFANAAKAAPSLLYALRLWAAVCLALFVAFWLELDNAFWAGTSAAIVCQLQLGASLRKGWFRMIGTVVGATMIVVLTACFPQDRIAFLVLLALWGGLCAFAATAFRNFASYAAALAVYTAAIIAADNLGATGGASSDVFLLAVTRASEICIGIACAGIVLAGTDLGGAQHRLADSFANLAAEIMDRFGRMLALAETQLPDTKTERREFVRRVIALDPMIDQALGESSHLRYHSPNLQTTVYGLFRAPDRWPGVATHFSALPDAARGPGANGASTIIFVTVIVLLLSPKGDLAYAGSLAFALGVAGAVVCAAAVKFAMLPALQTFPAFCAALGFFYLPAGFAMAASRQPIVIAALTAMTFNFNPLLAPTNEMNYDTAQYYNSALAIVVGCGLAPLAFWLLPPLSPALRVRRLLAFSSRDLRRLAIASVLPTPDYWESRIYNRFTALPDQATPLQRAQLLAALSVGTEIIGLRQIATHLGTTAELDAALNYIALGHSTEAIAKLRQFDDRIASARETGTEVTMALRGRGRILVISEALAEHGAYFDAGAPA